MSTLANITTGDINKNINIKSSELFKEIFIKDKETIESEERQGRAETRILNAIQDLGVKIVHNPNKRNERSYNTFTLRRNIAQISAVKGLIDSNTDKVGLVDPDADETYIDVEIEGLTTKSSALTHELHQRQKAMSSSEKIDVGLEAELMQATVEEHKITQYEFKEYDILNAVDKIYTQKKTVKNRTNNTTSTTTSNATFTGSYFPKNQPLQVNSLELLNINQELIVNRKKKLGEQVEMVMFLQKDCFNKYMEAIFKDNSVQNQMMMERYADAKMLDILNKGAPGDVSTKMKILQQQFMMSFKIGGIKMVVVSSHQEGLLLNPNGTDFDIIFIEKNALDKIETYDPVATLGQQWSQNPRRTIVPSAYGIFLAHEDVDGITSGKYIDSKQVYTMAEHCVSPFDFTKAGRITLNNDQVFGNAGAKADAVAQSKTAFNNWAGKVGVPVIA